MSEAERVAREFFRESKSGNGIWVAYQESGCLSLKSGEDPVMPLWSTRERCAKYLNEVYSETELRPLEVPMEVFLAVWIEQGKEQGTEYCLNPPNENSGCYALFPEELKNALVQ